MSNGNPQRSYFGGASAPSRTQILECLGIVAGSHSVIVHVKAPSQIFCLSFEAALSRIEEFAEQSQGIIEAMLSMVYSIPGFRVMYANPLERQLIKNMRAMDRGVARAMWEMIDDLAEDDVINPPAMALTTREPA